ncbi:hypothetical protein CHUAL_004503 [Chamberlinius hualienensis]
MRGESSLRKMLRETAEKDRIINHFPPPFKDLPTPYRDTDFNSDVKESCIFNPSVTAGLKICKVVVVGDVFVGKTCLVNRFCHEVFDKDYKTTIGVDFEVERFDILHVPFNLQIWDTAGQERFKCIATSYYRGAHAVIIAFDLNNGHSLQNTPDWLSSVMDGNNGNPHVFLVGLKKDICPNYDYDMVEERAVRIAQELKAEYWACSSLTGENVLDFFTRVAALAFNASVQRELDSVPEIRGIAENLIKLNNNNLYDKSSKSKCVGCKINKG